MSVRRPKRESDPQPEIIEAVFEQPTVKSTFPDRTGTKWEVRQQRRAEYEAYGTPQEREPYYHTGFGRPLKPASHEQILGFFAGTDVEVTPVENPGLIYAEGRTFAASFKFGLLFPDQPRLSPDEIINLMCERFFSRSILHPRAAENMDVPIRKTQVKPWGKSICRLQVEVGEASRNTPANDQKAYHLQTEKFATAVRLTPKNLPVEPEKIGQYRHFVTVGYAPIEAIPTLQEVAQELNNSARDVSFAGVGAVDGTPFKV